MRPDATAVGGRGSGVGEASLPLPSILVASGGRMMGVSTLAALLVIASVDAAPDNVSDEDGPQILDAGARRDTLLAALGSIAADAPAVLVLVPGADRNTIAATFAVAKLALDFYPALTLAVVPTRLDPAIAGWVAEVFAVACAQFLGREVLVGPAIPDDPSLAAALAAGMPIGDAAHGSPAAEAARALYDRLAERLAAPAAPSSTSASTALRRRS